MITVEIAQIRAKRGSQDATDFLEDDGGTAVLVRSEGLFTRKSSVGCLELPGRETGKSPDV